MKVYNPTLEERAFLYQEAHDLAPLIRDLGSLSVVVQEVKSKKSSASALQKNRYAVTFVVAPESLGLRVQGLGGDVFHAAIAAKEEAHRQLNAIVNSLPRDFNAEMAEVKIPPELLH